MENRLIKETGTPHTKAGKGGRRASSAPSETCCRCSAVHAEVLACVTLHVEVDTGICLVQLRHKKVPQRGAGWSFDQMASGYNLSAMADKYATGVV